jgi:A/G-specific adenine glycosylase
LTYQLETDSCSEKELFFRNCIIDWYKINGRNFYWRTHFMNEWQWLMLELLLKKTRAENVNKIFIVITKKYYNPKKVINTDEIELANDLSPLGLYNQRTKALKIISRIIFDDYNGKIPLDKKQLLDIPYIGEYTANALLCFCFNKKASVVDVNVNRIITRYFGHPLKNQNTKRILEFADKLLPSQNWKEYNFALWTIL